MSRSSPVTETEIVLAAWRNRFPNNMYAWPGAPESFAAEAVKALGHAQCPAVGPDGINGCMRVAAKALDFLSDHNRPIGGQQDYNAEHLIQLASELRRTSAALSDTSTVRTVADPQMLVLSENEKTTLQRIAYARAAGIKIDPFWLDVEAALTVAVTSPERK